MNFEFNEFVGPFKEFGCKNDNRGGSISNLRILQLRQLDQEVGDWMLNLEFFEDSGA